MRVCYFGTYERDYPRNAILIEGLREAGVVVYECHVPVGERWRDKSGVCRGWSALALMLRLLAAYGRLIVRYWKVPTHDLMIVGYVGQFDMPLAWLLSRLRAVPLVFNPLVSLYDTFCQDRRLLRPGSATARLLWLLDRLACQAADLVLLDTAPHIDYFVREFRLPASKFRAVPVGADDRLFARQPPRPRRDGGPFEVLFIGKLIPLHGCETILRAAARLREHPIHFTIIGSGQQSALVRRLATEWGLTNVTLIDWFDYQRLPEYYARADLCLGIFGDSAKASRVVPNKVFQALAVGRPVLSGDSPALRAMFDPGMEVWVCRLSDAEDLARQLLLLAGDASLCLRLATRGHEAFQKRYGLRTIASLALACLSELIPGFAPGDRMTWGAQPEFYGPRHRFRENYLLQAIRRHATGRTLIDAACGAGTLARRLADDGYTVLGVDLSRDFLRYIHERRTNPRLHLIQGDIARLPCGSDQIDGIIAGEVLEHLRDDGAALREFRRVLRPGGICVISVPADPDQWDWHDDWAGHLRRYRRGDLYNIIERSGLKVICAHYFGFPLVRAFHRHVYLPRYRRLLRTSEGKLNRLSTKHGWQRLAIIALLIVFQFDNLFNRLPRGIGLIAIAQKPTVAVDGEERLMPHAVIASSKTGQLRHKRKIITEQGVATIAATPCYVSAGDRT